MCTSNQDSYYNFGYQEGGGGYEFIKSEISQSSEELFSEIIFLKIHSLDWDNASASAQLFWTEFEKQYTNNLQVVLYVAQELKRRNACVAEFFWAFVKSKSNNIQAVIYYLDYLRLKTESECELLFRQLTGQIVPEGKEGIYDFDGYITFDVPSTEEEKQEIILDVGDEFPASTNGERCWWKWYGCDFPF